MDTKIKGFYIPPEISLEIFSYLSIQDLTNVIESSKLASQSYVSIGTSTQCTEIIDKSKILYDT